MTVKDNTPIVAPCTDGLCTYDIGEGICQNWTFTQKKTARSYESSDSRFHLDQADGLAIFQFVFNSP